MGTGREEGADAGEDEDEDENEDEDEDEDEGEGEGMITDGGCAGVTVFTVMLAW